MSNKLKVVAVVMSILTYATAGTVAIGIINARGYMRVDSYTVENNATLFDGSVVETGQSPADLRLKKGAEITLATGSRGTLYSDRMVLQQGESELSSSDSFRIEANGLRVSATSPNSRGMVTVKSGNTIEVAALHGSFGITSTHGVLVATVHPGQPLSFAIDAGTPGIPLHSDFEGTGIVESEGGNYFLTVGGVKYQIEGKDTSGDLGKTVQLKGTVEGLIADRVVSGETPAADAIAVIHVAHHDILGNSAVQGWVIGGIAARPAVGVATGIYGTGNDGTRHSNPLNSTPANKARLDY